jgi:hypothetical protein
MLAKTYSREVRPRKQNSIEAWKALIRFEAWLYRLGVGAPKHQPYDTRCWNVERDVMDQAVTLARSEIVNGRLVIDESKAISFEDQRVMSFAFRLFPSRYGGSRIVRDRTPRQVIFASEIQSLACRRALLYMLARSFRCTEN